MFMHFAHGKLYFQKYRKEVKAVSLLFLENFQIGLPFNIKNVTPKS